jgi:hypothetical protein
MPEAPSTAIREAVFLTSGGNVGLLEPPLDPADFSSDARFIRLSLDYDHPDPAAWIGKMREPEYRGETWTAADWESYQELVIAMGTDVWAYQLSRKLRGVNPGGWIGCDLDGTLAYYDHWQGVEHVGPPVLPMLARVKAHLRLGQEVRIVTARAAACDRTNEHGEQDTRELAETAVRVIQDWTQKWTGQRLAVTATKDFGMVTLYDDRAKQVLTNTGLLLEELHA